MRPTLSKTFAFVFISQCLIKFKWFLPGSFFKANFNLLLSARGAFDQVYNRLWSKRGLVQSHNAAASTASPDFPFFAPGYSSGRGREVGR